MNEVLALVQELATILTPTAEAIERVLALLSQKNTLITELKATEAKEDEQEAAATASLKGFADALKTAQSSLTAAIAANTEAPAAETSEPVA